MTPRSPSAARRNKLQAVLVIAICAGGIVFAIVLALNAWRSGMAISAYESAAACASASDAVTSDRCRYDGDATVVSTGRSALLTAVVRFDSVPGRTFSTRFASDSEPAGGALTAGGKAPATLWNGRITRLAGVATVDDPHNSLTSTNLLVAAFVGLLSIAGVAAGAFMARDAWRRL